MKALSKFKQLVRGTLHRVVGRLSLLFRLFIGRKRMMFGFCPSCNGDAPMVDKCPICTWILFCRDEEKPKTMKEYNRIMWQKFVAQETATIHAAEGGVNRGLDQHPEPKGTKE